MIQSEPLATSSALASEEIKPNEHCEQCKEAVGGRSQRNCTKFVLQTATLSRFGIHFATTCKCIKMTEISRLERNVAVSIWNVLQNTGEKTWSAWSLERLQETRTKNDQKRSHAMRGESILVSGLACTTKGRFTKEKNKTFHMKLFIVPHESMTQKKWERCEKIASW